MMTLHLKSSSVIAVLAAILIALILVSGSLVPTVSAQDHRHSSVTGYYGIDEDGVLNPDRSGIMLVFDGAIAETTVSVNTFRVSLKDGTFAEVVETRVDGPYVFLKLATELASDATPIVGISEGEEVEDLAGNSTNRRKFGFVQVEDGIAPRLTVTLSGGSGMGTGDEGPNRLTNDTMDIRITSDEPLQGAPRVVVVCDDLRWTEREGARQIERDIDDFITNRNGPFSSRPREPSGTSYTCGYDADHGGKEDVFDLTEDIANSRPGQAWELTWRNPTGPTTGLKDGELVVVAYGHDRSRYERFGTTVSNWATAMAGFGFDTRFGSDEPEAQVKFHPPDGSVIHERRPFVLLEFPEATSVNLVSVLFDGEEIVNEFEVVESNEFVYWPLSMNQGHHSVEVEAKDSGRNETELEFQFETTRRGDFVLPLVAGWNAISLPADPVNPAIDEVFNDREIKYVVAWDTYDLQSPWAVSVRNEGKWETPKAFRAVTRILAGKGYWVNSSEFSHLHVELHRVASVPLIRESDRCSDHGGWHFVGVHDEDGDQTENHFGDTLRFNGSEVQAREFFGRYYVAYRWDPVEAQYERIAPEDAVRIGDGVWVYGGAYGLCP